MNTRARSSDVAVVVCLRNEHGCVVSRGRIMANSPRSIPRIRTLESGPALLWDGYEFIAKRARQLRSDVFCTRLMFQETICLTGEAGARLFYNPEGWSATQRSHGRGGTF